MLNSVANFFTKCSKSKEFSSGNSSKHGLDDVKPKTKEKKISFYQLFRYSTTFDRIRIVFGAFCAMLSGVAHPLMAIFYGEVVGVIVDFDKNYKQTHNNRTKEQLESKMLKDVNFFVTFLVLSGFIILLTTYLAGVLFNYTCQNQVFRIKKLLLESTLNQDISWYDVNKTGDFATNFTANISKVEEAMGEKFAFFIYFQTVIITGVSLALIFGWKLGLVCMVPLPLSAGITGFINWLSSKYSEEESEAYNSAGLVANEVFGSVRTVIAFEGQEKEVNRYKQHLNFAKYNNIKKSLFSAVSNGIMWFFIFATYGLAFWYGFRLILDDRHLPLEERTYTAANTLRVFFCSVIALWNYGAAAQFFDIFGAAKEAATRLFEIIDHQPLINLQKNNGETIDAFNGNILFENIYFQYPSRPDVKILQGLNLKIQAGETVALVGSSGCGKTTCTQLLQRFYDPQIGKIYFDGKHIKDLDLTWLRNQSGLVGQEPVLFASTIAENIKYGCLSATQADIEEAARKANVHDFITSLPHGYDTMIGEQGSQLSGGQKQRIAIARALTRKPKILLLDEATSALDTTSEAEVQAALDSIRGECTTIIVAHRLSTIRNADRIVFISDGRVLEDGTHDELIEAKKGYFNLIQSQCFSESDNKDENIDVAKTEILKNTKDTTSALSEYSSEDDYNDTEEGKSSKSPIMTILRMSRMEWVYLSMGLIASLIIGAGLPIHGLIFGFIMGTLSDPRAWYVRQESNIFCLYFVVLGCVIGFATFLQIYSFGVAGEKLTFQIRDKMFSAMLKQEMGWFDRKENGVGALCTKLSGDAASVHNAGGIRLGTILHSFSTFLMAHVLIFYFNWKLSLVLVPLSPILLSGAYFEQKFTQRSTLANQKNLENSAKIAVESIGNIRTVASLGCEQIFLEKYVSQLFLYMDNVKKNTHLRSFVVGFPRAFIAFSYALGMWYGAKLMVDDKMNYSIVIKVIEIKIVGYWAISNAFAFTPNFHKGVQAIHRISKFLKRTPKIENIPNPLISKAKGKIDYSKVHFAYPTRMTVPILENLDLSVLEGKTVALIGSSGCGKSTIVQLLQRFYDPHRGKVSIDDTNIANIDISNLRSHLGIVSQEPNLFDRTIAENIAYGANNRDVTTAEIIEAAKSANIHNFITSLTMGYETNLGSRGAQLSGGQKQRVAIARALIRNPRVLLLDEATSALDNESEKLVQEALDRAKKNRTCIIIAHRLTTIQDADVICVLKNRKVAEMGTHEELLEKKELYYQFYKKQTGQK